MLPDIDTAEQLFQDIALKTDVINARRGICAGESSSHYLQVAKTARLIAAYCNMNPEKAYILGLLHDYGEYIEKTVKGTFHGTAGYDEMMKLGYDEVARTCLSHSFWEGNENPDDFAYDRAQLVRAFAILKTMEPDDYDRLIQLSDLLSGTAIFCTLEQRIDGIITKYRLNPSQSAAKKAAANKLKHYFDAKCGHDIYAITEQN